MINRSGKPGHHQDARQTGSGPEDWAVQETRWLRQIAADAQLVPCRSFEDVFTAVPGTLEHWLVERYCLYTVRSGTVDRVEIDHEPWPLQRARARIERNDVAAAAGIGLSGESPDLLHFARRLDVRIWGPRPAAG